MKLSNGCTKNLAGESEPIGIKPVAKRSNSRGAPARRERTRFEIALLHVFFPTVEGAGNKLNSSKIATGSASTMIMDGQRDVIVRLVLTVRPLGGIVSTIQRSGATGKRQEHYGNALLPFCYPIR
jgi:hypothetical protein